MTDFELYEAYRGWGDPHFLNLSREARQKWSDVAAAVGKWGDRQRQIGYDEGYDDGWDAGEDGD
ncbi:hypothetical protein [Mycobacterium phage WXIN]|nr:hypothetical protein [Mycobacterium phage WXIN]